MFSLFREGGIHHEKWSGISILIAYHHLAVVNIRSRHFCDLKSLVDPLFDLFVRPTHITRSATICFFLEVQPVLMNTPQRERLIGIADLKLLQVFEILLAGWIDKHRFIVCT